MKSKANQKKEEHIVRICYLCGKTIEGEGYIECMQVTPAGAVFYQSGNLLKLKDEEIEKEVREI